MAPTAHPYIYARARLFHLDEAHQALSGEKSGLGYRLGDPVQVKLVEAVPLAGALRFEMLSEGRKMPTAMRSFHKAGRRDRTGARKRPGRDRPAAGTDSRTHDVRHEDWT